MLTIRKEQMAVFETLFSRRFRAELRRHVRTEFASQTLALGDPALDKLLSAALSRGQTYGITTERDLTLFVDLNYLLGPDFELQRKLLWARKILLDKDLEGGAKMTAIYQRLGALENRAEANARAT